MPSTQITQKRTIDYISFDYDALKGDLITFLNETASFKDADYVQSNINTLTGLFAYIGALFGYYINSAANEVFLSTAKRYKNLNKIAQMLRYDPRGVESSSVDVVGSLLDNYVFGKAGQYIEIPAYSFFPSTLPTQNGQKFNFTNPQSLVHLVTGFGVSQFSISDISYNGYALPFAAPAEFFYNESNTPYINPINISLPLSLQKPLSIIKVDTVDNYYGFDTDNYPKFNPADSSSVGQPFINTVFAVEYSQPMVPEVPYYLVFNWDPSTSTPYISIVEDQTTLGIKQKDVLAAIILTPTDDTNTNYILQQYEAGQFNRFFTGVLGIENLESANLEFDFFPNSTTSIQAINLVINKDGNSPPMTVLVNGVYYTFSSGTISSQKFEQDFFSSDATEYFVNLSINDPTNELTNYGAALNITTAGPIANEVTIGTITTGFTDVDSGISALKTSNSKRFGNFQVIPPSPTRTSVQKAGRAFFASGQTLQKIQFNEPFVLTDDQVRVDYDVQLTPDGNVRSWFAEADENGFTIYIEPNTQFTGYISWIATTIITDNIRQKSVVFDSPIPLGISENGTTSNYMVQLTPNENIQVWYENLSTGGFNIQTEKSFKGKVSWSVYNFFSNDTVPSEPDSGYRQKGRVLLPKGVTSQEIVLATPITDINYAIQLIPNANVNVFYTNKTPNGFTLNIEAAVDQIVTIDWYVDSSIGYSFQKHGEIDFSGSLTSEATIPGFRFANIPETFVISSLLQGDITFTYINSNTVIDTNNNGLEISVDPTRLSADDVRYIVNNENISTNSIRVFIKNDSGNWDEWQRAGIGYDIDVSVGKKIFYVRVNPDQLILIEFGDGVSYGVSPLDKETIILGLNSVGNQGNINKGLISPEVIVSQYILGNDQTDIKFESNFVSLLGLKSKQFFDGNSPSTSIIDSDGTALHTGDLTIVQDVNAFGGNIVETPDELRKNASNYFVTQGRNVSTNDTLLYVQQVFSNYIQAAEVLTYTEIKEAGLLSPEELEKYWFNHIFVVALNKNGSNTISKNLGDLITTKLNSSSIGMIGQKYGVVPATWVPIDILVRYTNVKNSNPETIEAQMRKNLGDYFNPANHSLGEVINSSDIISLVNVDNVSSVEVMLNKDPGEVFTVADYTPKVTTVTTEQEADQARKNRLMQLVSKDPSLVKIFQPLFSSLQSDGTVHYDYTLRVELAKFEFPQLGKIIIERDTSGT
jgi:hypothetical protein